MSAGTKERPPKAKDTPAAPKVDEQGTLLSKQVSELTDKFNTVLDVLSKNAETNAAIAAAMNAMATRQSPEYRTRVAPVVHNEGVDSGDMELPKMRDVEMLTGGAPGLIREEIEVAERPLSLDHAAELAFNEEKVEVLVHESDNPLAEPIVEVYNNGVIQIFPRGIVVTCRRKYLEGLVRAKPVTYQNVEYVKDDGSRAVKYPRRSSLRYPFQVVRDDNPRGRVWLRDLMQRL